MTRESQRIKKRLIALIKSKSPYLDAKTIDCSGLFFEERVLLNCFHCIRYNVNWTCPPNIPDIDYRKLILEYDNALMVYCRMPFAEKKLDIVRRDSTNILHRALLDAERFLWEHNYPLAKCFIGGSCKLCAQGCDPHRCRQPGLARIPIEAAGVNVVESAKNIDLNITFPPKDYLYRVGLLLW
jgi:predicted metal-binding protein